MSISGILVVARRCRLEAALAALADLPGVEVHHTDPATGRIVVIQEAASVEAEIAGLRRIQTLPDVVLAEMAYHYFEEPAPAPGGPTPHALDD